MEYGGVVLLLRTKKLSWNLYRPNINKDREVSVPDDTKKITDQLHGKEEHKLIEHEYDFIA